MVISTHIFALYNGSAVADETSSYYEFVTLSEAELTVAIRQAKALGLKVMLKPHVDLLRDEKVSTLLGHAVQMGSACTVQGTWHVDITGVVLGPV